MKSIGGWLIVLGLGSFVLQWLGYDFRLLSWVDNWGSTIGLVIRLSCVVVGIALCVLGSGRGGHGRS